MRQLLLPLMITLLLLGACAQNQTFLTSDEKLAKADELFDKGKYNQAVTLYSEIYFERSSGNAAYALMREADSYFKTNKFTEARTAYEEFTSTFPNNPEMSRAMYQSALCLYEESLSPQYDQTETMHCIDAFKKFLEKYPNDEKYSEALSYIQKAKYKLIEKKYKTGYIYYKMKDYSAALMYLREVTILGNSDALDRNALYYSTLILYKQKLQDQAALSYAKLQTKYPGSKESKKLAKYFP